MHLYLIVVVSLLGMKELIYGIYNTIAGGNSIPSSIGENSPIKEQPKNACDNTTFTKYLNSGKCPKYGSPIDCGLNTGLYVTLERGASIVVGFQLCAANDFPSRDPITITLEGTNEVAKKLTLGSSWTLMYSGFSGLNNDPGRYTCGEKRLFSNSVEYASYRFLVTGKRDVGNSVQYSELRLFGF
ncbi:unnamed protein product [Rotaria sp. Silwood1]|nr:unnamed protein product [Rotaria sp. Silwood1]